VAFQKLLNKDRQRRPSNMSLSGNSDRLRGGLYDIHCAREFSLLTDIAVEGGGNAVETPIAAVVDVYRSDSYAATPL